MRGHIKTRRNLNFGDFQVFGHLTLPAGSSGERLNALGRVEFEGDGRCKAFEVNGVARVKGDLETETVKVNGKLDVEGGLKVSDRLEVLGSAEAKGQIECGTLAAGGRLVAARVTVAGQAELGGEVRTARGLKAGDIAVGTGSRINGPISGKTIEIGRGLGSGGFWAQVSNWRSIGRMTRVDDVYGREVRVDSYSQAKRIYAETVRMRPGSMADEVNFTKEADISEGVHLERPQRKLEALPDAPL